MPLKRWLIFALVTTVSWGLWGALTSVFSGVSMPSTMVYSIWAVTMIVPCVVVMQKVRWQLQTDTRSIVLGCTIGFLGSGGQLVLFHAITVGPGYLIFPIVSLSPLVTIVLSMTLLRERTNFLGVVGIILALVALPLFEYGPSPDEQHYGVTWFAWALVVMAAWGIQAYCMKFSNNHMSAESIFFYMTITALLLIPAALMMTDFNTPIDFSASTISINAGIQVLNALGALALVYAFRYGKAIVVSPLTNAGAPLISAVLTIILLGVVPPLTKVAGIVLAVIAAIILALEPEVSDEKK